jgi:vesicle-associated membrane protein 7
MSGLIYSFVAREGTVLAEHSALAGNFRAVAVECLQNSQITDDKFTVTADAYTFNYLVHSGYTFLVVADEAYGRQIPFAFLERLRDAFMEKFADRARTAPENSLNSSFGPTIKRQMEYCRDHPEEISKMVSVQRKVDEVKGIMMQIVEKVLVRGERLDVLVDRTDDLRDQAAKFQRQGTQLRKKMWWQNFRMQIIVVGVVVLLVVVIFLLACFTGGRNCVSKGGSAPAPAPGNSFAPTPGAPAGFSASSLSPGEPMPGQGTGGSVPAPAPATVRPGGNFAPTPGAPPGFSDSTMSPGTAAPGKLLRLLF